MFHFKHSSSTGIFSRVVVTHGAHKSTNIHMYINPNTRQDGQNATAVGLKISSQFHDCLRVNQIRNRKSL